MNKKETAILLIEYQNDFTSKGGIFHDAVKGIMEQTNMLSNTVALVWYFKRYCRQQGFFKRYLGCRNYTSTCARKRRCSGRR
jgi:outer membrane protein W